jgi:hypothetical protein
LGEKFRGFLPENHVLQVRLSDEEPEKLKCSNPKLFSKK